MFTVKIKGEEFKKRNNEAMKAERKAVAYVCAIPIKGTDLVIGKDDQRMRILKYAQKEGIAVIRIFEDEAYCPDCINRPGIKDLLACCGDFDMVLVERVWSLSRVHKELEVFLDELDKKHVEFATSSYLWDCLSQRVRNRYLGSPAKRLRQKALECVEETHHPHTRKTAA